MANMQLVFLGTSSAAPTVERGLSSIALMRGGELLLFDAGEGMQRNFIKAGLGMNRKMKIFISHMHADHCVGLLGLLQTMALQGRERSIDIYGEPRVKEFLEENMRIINFGLTFDVIVHTIKNEGVVVKEDEYQVTCCEASHSIPSFAYCLEEFDRPGAFNVKEAKRLGIPEGELYSKLQHGQDIVYKGKKIRSSQIVGPPRKGRKVGISGDTRPTDKLAKFFHGCDVLVFESTYSQDKQQKAIENWHSTAAEAAAIAKKAKVGRLFLTHFSARYDETSVLVKEASAIHPNVEAAEDLKVVEIPYP
ncbi:ribonuclease Z [Candidatus Nitrososphaera gargensis Ga9.2]|uniref:Ribonuclease Z n=1 Tax=Nitrososphaera gargensis (strain Ga9.2) TaxID=1237085 RepID=K0ID03_NITGG|nr:ribonuclease Z [Candidatus Nitrososphaera gargensis]AFU59256.1 ribonuclease Z [Candidatus Nitrososphaera gargensis Ga9.2]